MRASADTTGSDLRVDQVPVERVERVGRPTSPAMLRLLERGALLQAAAALHLEGLLTDAELRATQRRLAALR